MQLDEKRLRLFIDKLTIAEGNECWTWAAYRNPRGYGTFCIGHGKQRLAHRVAHEQWGGNIKKGHTVHHTCHTRSCVNPDHLLALSHTDHMALHRAERLLTETNCKQCGAERSEENTYTTRAGYRNCRPCKTAKSRAGNAAYYKANKAQLAEKQRSRRKARLQQSKNIPESDQLI